MWAPPPPGLTDLSEISYNMWSQIHRGRADAECARIAALQWGVLGRAQARSAGLTPKQIHYRLANGRWEAFLPSVYLISGTPFVVRQRLMAAVLWGGPEAVVFRRSAAALWELEGGRDDPPEIASPRQLRDASSRVRAHRSATIGPADVTMLGPLPVTTPGRTLIDLGGVLGEPALEVSLDQALRSHRVSVRSLRDRIEELAPQRLPGLSRLRRLVDERDPARAPTDSELETLVHRWLRTNGFPAPVFQHWVTLPAHGPARLDFAYPDKLVGVEADSYAWHSGRSAFERDRARIGELASLGWIVIQTTHREIRTRPDLPAQRLRRALALRS
jgi:very-short-patch-repair endonuclease